MILILVICILTFAQFLTGLIIAFTSFMVLKLIIHGPQRYKRLFIIYRPHAEVENKINYSGAL